MHSCGMYDYAGEWGYRIGLAAKSGVGGGIIAVLPGQFGIGTFSPLLDANRETVAAESKSVKSYRNASNCICSGCAPRAGCRCPPPLARDHSPVQKDAQQPGTGDSQSQRPTVICVYELQGNLYFGALEQVFRKVAA